MSEPVLRKPYDEHIKEAQEQLMKIKTARWEAVSRVYELEQSILTLERHIGTIIELEKKAAGLSNAEF